MSDESNTEHIQRADVPESTTTQEEYFNTKTWRTDLALIVEDKVLHVSKLVLAIVSPVFEAMFNGEYSEKDKNEIVLPGKKYNDVLEFLRCIYPNFSTPVTLENVNVVLPLAEEYQVDKLKASCESCLLASLADDISMEQLLVRLEKAHLFNLQRVTERCMDIASDRPHSEVDRADTKVSLAKDIKDAIRIRMLQKMDKKYKDVVKYVGTSRALCKFLGEAAKQQGLMNEYMEGHLVGDWIPICINSTFKKSENLSIESTPFTVRIGKLIEFGSDSVYVFIGCMQKHVCISCFSAVIVRNWMKGKDDILKTCRFQFKKSSTSEKSLLIDNAFVLVNEAAGFICKDTINIDFFLFIRKTS